MAQQRAGSEWKAKSRISLSHQSAVQAEGSRSRTARDADGTSCADVSQIDSVLHHVRDHLNSGALGPK